MECNVDLAIGDGIHAQPHQECPPIDISCLGIIVQGYNGTIPGKVPSASSEPSLQFGHFFGQPANEAHVQVFKKPPWRNVLKKVRDSVQYPPDGPFDRTNLIWEEKTNHGGGKTKTVKKANIPWNRIDHFLAGEMDNRQFPCTFVEENILRFRSKESRARIRAESAIQETKRMMQRKLSRFRKQKRNFSKPKKPFGEQINRRGQHELAKFKLASLSGRLSQATKDQIQASLRSGKSPAQVMAGHKLKVLRCTHLNLSATRNTFVLPADVHNIAKKITKELWKKHQRDAISVRMWTLENPETWFHYKEYGNIDLNETPDNDDPFCLAIQTQWQLEMMCQCAKGALSIDATFSVNVPKYPLYTVMVFDEWEQGITVAFVVLGKTRAEDVQVWLEKLRDCCITMKPDWQPNAVVVDNDQAELNARRTVWPDEGKVKILLCLWHVRKAWLENATQKIKANYVRTAALQDFADLMYGSGSLEGDAAVKASLEKFQHLRSKYPGAKSFLDYFQKTWI